MFVYICVCVYIDVCVKIGCSARLLLRGVCMYVRVYVCVCVVYEYAHTPLVMHLVAHMTQSYILYTHTSHAPSSTRIRTHIYTRTHTTRHAPNPTHAHARTNKRPTHPTHVHPCNHARRKRHCRYPIPHSHTHSHAHTQPHTRKHTHATMQDSPPRPPHTHSPQTLMVQSLSTSKFGDFRSR